MENIEIKFRGKRVDNNEWVYGHFMIGLNNLTYIINKRVVNETETVLDYTIVNEQSLGQFTGLKDKNGVDIYQGDILNFGNNNNVPVVFENGCFSVFDEPLGWDFDTENQPVKTDFQYCTVIGNIHENPELLNK